MASFDFDQAEGLRRMLAGPRPRIVTFLSATPEDDKGAMLVNLGASLAQAGNDVLIVDACEREYGVAQRLGMDRGPSLLQVARQESALNEIIHKAPQGFSVASLSRAPLGSGRTGWVRGFNGTTRAVLPAGQEEQRRLGKAFDVMAQQAGIVIVDGEIGEHGFALPALENSELVVQVSTSATSITNGYALVKRLAQQFGRRPFGILVTDASEAEAKVVYANMSSAATRYLAVTLSSMGSVPADEYLQRAARLGRAVVDAFPLAGASVAFRQLAGRFAMAGSQSRLQGGGAHFGT
ncbi:MAG: MinD/ParA family ATP-binding protein [Telluria sp.]